MHMSDALVSPAVAGTLYACSTLAAGYSIRKIKLENDPKKIPTMGVMGAFVFAAQMINFTIPGTGSSGHLCGGILLSAMLGPFAGFLTMIGILLIQCFLFADGGLMALGCNVWNMAAYGCFIGGLLIWKPMMRKAINKRKITIASILACILTLQLGAFSVTLETFMSGITELPFQVFVAAMQPIHLVIGLVEGLVTAAVLCFVYEARPELLWNGRARNGFEEESQKSYGRLSRKVTLLILGIVTVLVAAGLSLFASANPDGLEWSIEKVTGSTEIAGGGPIFLFMQKIQNTTALLPDYGFAGQESALGTSVSGLIGAVLVIAVCIGFCTLVRLLKGAKTKK